MTLLSGETCLSKERIVRASLSLALAAGSVVTAAACTDGKVDTHVSASPSPSATAVGSTECSSLQYYHFTGGSKRGGVNAVNTGECVAIYNHPTATTPEVIGQIARHGGSFVIKCYSAKGPGYQVETDGATGYVELGHFAVPQLNQPLYIPDCSSNLTP